jgi:histidinol-phosphate aminotransferase
MPFVQLVYPSDANFLLVKLDDAISIYEYLKGKGIIVRNRSNVILCEGCLRITIGTEQENRELIDALGSFNTK